MRRLAKLCFICCLLVLTGCAGRATSYLEYTPPAAATPAKTDNSVIVNKSADEARTLTVALMQRLGCKAMPGGQNKSELLFSGILPSSSLREALDCGRLSINTPGAGNPAQTFPALSEKEIFPMADGTSVPKPARLDAAATATVTVTLLPEGKKKTRLLLQTRYEVNLNLTRWVMISGFSPMVPQRISKLTTEHDVITFSDQETGSSTKPLPDFRYQIEGTWPVQCASSGSFTRWLLDELKKI